MNRGKLIPEQIISPAQMGSRMAAAFDKAAAILKLYQIGYILANGDWRLAPSTKRVNVVPEHSILFVHQQDWFMERKDLEIVGTFLLNNNKMLVYKDSIKRIFEQSELFDIRIRIMFDHAHLMMLGARYG